MPRSGIKYAGGVLRALTGGCYRGAVAPLGLSVTHIHSSPEGISVATLQKTASEEKGKALLRDLYQQASEEGTLQLNIKLD